MRGSDVNKVSKSSTKKIDPYGDQSGHTQWSTQRSVGGYQGNSYEPQGTSLMEKKLKKPRQFFNQADIKPIYPDEPPQELDHKTIYNQDLHEFIIKKIYQLM